MYLSLLSGSPGKKGRKGFILVSILLVMTLLVAGATGYAWFARNQLKILSSEKFALQSRGIAYAAVLQISKGLQYDDNDFDSYTEPWFQKQFIPIPDLGIVIIDIAPLDDKIPLNELFLPDGATLRTEMDHTWKELWNLYGNPRAGTIILDFIDTNKRPRLGGLEQDFYPNRDLADISELRILGEHLEGVLPPPPMVPRLENLVTIWSSGKINLNVAPYGVLLMIDGINGNAAQEIIEFRQRSPLESMEDLEMSSTSFENSAVPRIVNLVGFKSSYFRVSVQIRSLMDQSVNNYNAILLKESSSCRIVKWEEN